MPPEIDEEVNPYTDDSEVQTDDDRAYSEAFAELQGEKPESSTPDEPGESDDADQVVEGSDESVVADGAANPPDDDATAASATDSDDPDDHPAASAADAQVAVTQGEDFSKTIADLQAQIAALKEAQSVPPAPAPEEPDTPEKPLYTEEEQQLLKQYGEDWGDVQRGEALTRRAEYQQLVQYIFDQVHSVYGPALDYVEGRSGKDQYADIKARVDDYDTVRDQAIAWAEQQPSYLKAAYQQVIENGTAEEVADFINRFKQDTGYAQTATTTQTSPATVAAPPATDPKKSAAAAALRVVKTKRSETTAEPDSNDFSAAFKEFAAMK